MSKAAQFVRESVKRHGELLISILEDVQDSHGYLPENYLREVSVALDIPLRNIYSIATFYRAFRLKPPGKYRINVCLGTACHIRGGVRIFEKFSRDLGIVAGETTKDKKFSLETVNCLGACALGPVVVVNYEYHGNMDVTKVGVVLKKCR